MSDFSLSKPKRYTLPDTVKVDGSVYKIRPDHRTILKILRMYNDPEVREDHKGGLMCKWFFVGEVRTELVDGSPEEVIVAGVLPPDPQGAFSSFVMMGEELKEQRGKRDLDYEFDAEEIYTSILQLFRIDLFDTAVHWWRFRAMVSAALTMDTPLSHKVKLRNFDIRKAENPGEIYLAWQSVQIPDTVSIAEQRQNDAIADAIMNGKSLEGLL